MSNIREREREREREKEKKKPKRSLTTKEVQRGRKIRSNRRPDVIASGFFRAGDFRKPKKDSENKGCCMGFFPWMGGKSRMLNRLLAVIPPHQCYVEVFAGAANLLFAKPPAGCEVLNDINGDLIGLFRVVKFHRVEFLRELLLMTHSRREFSDFKAQPGLTDIQCAARFYMILKSCFGGKGGTTCSNFGYGTTGRARFNRISLSAVRRCHKRLNGVIVENLDFADCIKRYDRPHTFFYCDPPYLDSAGYKDGFDLRRHKILAGILRSIRGKFLLSVNDNPVIRVLYKGMAVVPVCVKYTVCKTDFRTPDNKELLIANYPLSRVALKNKV